MNGRSAGRAETFVTEFESNRRPSEVVVEAIAEVENVSVTNLEPRLYDVLNPDALNTLMTERPRPERIVFSYLGHEVAIRRDGTVVVE